MSRSLLFWDVDTQVDFMLPGGKLYVPGAEQIIPNLVRLTAFARQRRIPVLASADAHQPGDSEFAHYPPHCVAGTPGQAKIPETRLVHSFVVQNASVRLPNELSRYAQIIVEKQALDVFTNPNIEEVLRKFGPREVVLYGVVTEICVRHAALGLLDRGYRVHVVTDAVRALNEEQAKGLLKQMTHGGVSLTSTAEVIKAAQSEAA